MDSKPGYMIVVMPPTSDGVDIGKKDHVHGQGKEIDFGFSETSLMYVSRSIMGFANVSDALRTSTVLKLWNAASWTDTQAV
jgi:hypothetical protein